jgi:WD40 repeat protein
MHAVTALLLGCVTVLASTTHLHGEDKDKKPSTDYLGDPLPDGVLLRLGTERLRHHGPIGLLRFTSDGKSLLSTGFDGETIVWDVQTGKRVVRPDLPKHLLTLPAAVSQDERYLAVFRGSYAELEVREAATGKTLFKQKNDKQWSDVAFTSDGKTLVALSRDNKTQAWEVPGGKESSVQKFGFAPWRRFAEDPPSPTLAADGSVLAGVLKEDWGKVTDETRVHFWDPLTGKENRPAITLPRWWKRWELSADGRLLTAYFWDGELQIWETEKGKPFPIAGGLKLGGDDIALLPGKRLAAIAAEESACMVDLATGRTIWAEVVAPYYASGPLLKVSMAKSIAVSLDEKVVAVGMNCGHIALLDSATGKPVGFSKEHPGFFSCSHGEPLQFLPDGKTVIVHHTKPDVFCLTDPKQGKLIRELPGYNPIFSPDGSVAIVEGREDKDPAVSMVDTTTGKTLWSIDKRPAPGVLKIHFASDSRSLAIYDSKRGMLFLDAQTGKLSHTFPRRAVAVSPNMKQVVTADSNFELWDVATNEKLWTSEAAAKHGAVVRFQASGKHLVVATPGNDWEWTGSDFVWVPKGSIFVIDLATGKTVREVTDGSEHQFSPDGHAVAYFTHGKDDYGFELRDMDTGKVVLKRKIDGGIRNKYCAFSPDSRIFACSTDDGVLEFYDAHTGKRLGPPRKHWAYIHSISFAPDGTSLAASYNDSTILFWEVPTSTVTN